MPIITTTTTTTTLQHPTLGLLTGRAAAHGIRQFLGIRYATLAHKFAAPELADGVDDGDCTRFGSTPPQPPNGIVREVFKMGFQTHVGEEVVMERERQSETEGLTLHVTLPPPQNIEGGEGRLVPVLVFIHGGNFATGSANWPHHDAVHFLHTTRSRPTIVVTINYRTNYPGFLYLPGTPCPSNRGLLDQQTALRFIRTHIAGFGGDPENMTVAGESAGSASVELLCRRSDHGIRRALLMSGTTSLLPPMPTPVHRAIFDKVCSALSLPASLSDADRVALLSALPASEFYTHPSLPPVASFPFFPHATPDTTSSNPFRVSSTMIGDSAHDGGILTLAMPPDAPRSFVARVTTHLPPRAARKLLELYDLPRSGKAGLDAVFNDMGFWTPAVALAREAQGGGEVVYYNFNEPNPAPGIWVGQANHVLDVAYLFGGFDDTLPEGSLKAALAWREAVVRFVHGESEAGTVEEPLVFGKDWGRREEVWEVFGAAGPGGEKLVRGVVLGFWGSAWMVDEKVGAAGLGKEAVDVDVRVNEPEPELKEERSVMIAI